MSGKLKCSVLAAAAASAVFAAQAQAGFTYDLRVAPVSAGINDGSNVSVVDTKTVTLAGPAIVTLQLWGQITGNTTTTDDYWNLGYVGVTSVKGGNGFIASGGGGITNATLNSVFGSSNGTSNNITSDGVTDWGSTNTATKSSWLSWSNATAGPSGQFGQAGGGTVGEAIAGTNNGWEILIATFTVSAATLNPTAVLGDTTSFNVPGIPVSVKTGLSSTSSGLVYYPDGSTQAVFTGAIGAPVVLEGVPEPASLGVLALGGLALLARRRKTA
jgi:hypothetical protein